MSLISRTDCFAIFGARGMAGSSICRSLERSGYHHILKPNRQELDLLDPIAVDNWFLVHNPSVAVLAAAKVGGIYANSTYPADFLLENLKIQTHVIESAWRSGVRRFLFLGSSCIYPKFASQPIKEDSLLTGSLESTNECYAIAKIAGIKLCEALHKQHGFDGICLMPTNLYGPGDNYHQENSHVLPALIRRFHDATEKNLASVTCWGSGNALREFLYVDDLGDACVFALENWQNSPSQPPTINVGTGKDLSIRQLAEMIADIIGFKGVIHWDTTKPSGTPKKQLDVTRLANLGWLPKIGLEEGLARTYDAFLHEVKNATLRS